MSEMCPDCFSEFKNNLIDRFLDRFDYHIEILDEKDKNYQNESDNIPNFIFHEWVGYTQALQEWDIITDEQYEELRKIDVPTIWFEIGDAIDNETEEDVEKVCSIAEEQDISYTVAAGICYGITWKDEEEEDGDEGDKVGEEKKECSDDCGNLGSERFN